MKKLLLGFLILGATFATQAQETKPMPLITVSGEGKIKTVPDQVSIRVAVESKGSKAADVKKDNDKKTDAVLKYIKQMGIAATDFQTQRVYLNDEYDYEKKKHNYVATQSIDILLKDLSKYDTLMEGLVDTGINNISGVEFKSSKAEELKSQARMEAIRSAKRKAQDFSLALGQKVGKAFTVVDNSPADYPRPRYEMMAMKMADNVMGGNDTLAAGEIEITSNVSVSFILE